MGDIDELIRLGEIGHVTRIIEHNNEIESCSPDCGAFIDSMRAMVKIPSTSRRYPSALREGFRGARA